MLETDSVETSNRIHPDIIQLDDSFTINIIDPGTLHEDIYRDRRQSNWAKFSQDLLPVPTTVHG